MSMSGGRFKCGDTVLLSFNRKLDSCSTLLGPLVSLHQWEGFALNVDSATAETSWNSVSPGYFLSQDSLSVCFLMDSLHNSGHYRVQINTGYLTGDSARYDEAYLFKNAHAGLKARAKSSDTSVALPENMGLFESSVAQLVYPGDTAHLVAPMTRDSFYFARWLAPGESSIDSVTTPHLQRVYDCSNLYSILVDAEYSVMSKDTVLIIDTVGSTCGSYTVRGWADSLGGNMYTVYRGPGFGLEIVAWVPDTSCIFVNWNSSLYAVINGWTIPLIRYVPPTNYKVKGRLVTIIGNLQPVPVQNPPPTCPSYNINITLDAGTCNYQPFTKIQPEGNVNSNYLFEEQGPYTAFASKASNTPMSEQITISVTNNCYEIVYVMINGLLLLGNDNCESATALANPVQFTVDVYDGRCLANVLVGIRQKRYTLELSMEATDSHKMGNNYDITRSPLGKAGDDWQFNAEKTVKQTRKTTYGCGDVVTLTPTLGPARHGDPTAAEIVGWREGSGYTSQDVIDNPNQIIRFAMNENRQARLLWEADKFLVTRFQLPVSNRRNEQRFVPRSSSNVWFDVTPDGKVAFEDKVVGAFSDWTVEFAESNSLVKIDFDFNKNIDKKSVYYNIRAADASHPEDLKHEGWFSDARTNVYPFIEGGKGGFGATGPSNTLWLQLYNPRIDRAPWAAQAMNLEWGSAIKSLSGQNLANPSAIRFWTAPPRIKIEVLTYKLLSDDGLEGWLMGDPEIEFVSSTNFAWASINGNLEGNYIMGDPRSIQRHFGTISVNSIHNVDQTEYYSPTTMHESQLQLDFDSWDEDRGAAFAATILGNAIKDIKEKAAIKKAVGDL